MSSLSYFRPKEMEEALDLLSSDPESAMIIAGGTDLIPRMRAGEIQPKKLVDLVLLPLNSVNVSSKEVSVGCRATHSQIVSSQALGEQFPALGEACRQIGGPSIRNLGTVGGNLVNASPSADSALPLLVYDASIVLSSKSSERIVSLSNFFRGPGETVLGPGEILREIKIPLAPDRTVAKFLKLGKRQAMSIAIVNVAVRITLGKKNRVSESRIAIGSAAPYPLRVPAAEEILKGQIIDGELIAVAASQARHASQPISDIRGSAKYRKKMVEVLVRRALTCVYEELAGDQAHA